MNPTTQDNQTPLLLDLCPDVMGKVVDELYKARERMNREHMTYIMNHARTLTFCNYGTRAVRRMPFGYHHIQRMLLFQERRPITGIQFISPKLSRNTLMKCLRDNQLVAENVTGTHPSLKKLNREKLCALLLQHGVVFHPHRTHTTVAPRKSQ